MTDRLTFDPDWVVAPGETLDAWFDEQGMPAHAPGALRNTRARYAERYGITPHVLNGILDGTRPITEADAIRLAIATGVSKVLWLALEHNFRVGLAAGKTWSRA